MLEQIMGSRINGNSQSLMALINNIYITCLNRIWKPFWFLYLYIDLLLIGSLIGIGHYLSRSGNKKKEQKICFTAKYTVRDNLAITAASKTTLFNLISFLPSRGDILSFPWFPDIKKAQFTFGKKWIYITNIAIFRQESLRHRNMSHGYMSLHRNEFY